MSNPLSNPLNEPDSIKIKVGATQLIEDDDNADISKESNLKKPKSHDKYYNDPTGKDEHSTPLFIKALGFQRIRILKKMLENGADINVVDLQGSTALIMSVHENYLKLAEFLIKKGADLNKRNEYGVTALIYATIKK